MSSQILPSQGHYHGARVLSPPGSDQPQLVVPKHPCQAVGALCSRGTGAGCGVRPPHQPAACRLPAFLAAVGTGPYSELDRGEEHSSPGYRRLRAKPLPLGQPASRGWDPAAGGPAGSSPPFPPCSPPAERGKGPRAGGRASPGGGEPVSAPQAPPVAPAPHFALTPCPLHAHTHPEGSPSAGTGRPSHPRPGRDTDRATHCEAKEKMEKVLPWQLEAVGASWRAGGGRAACLPARRRYSPRLRVFLSNNNVIRIIHPRIPVTEESQKAAAAAAGGSAAPGQ